MVLVGPAKLFPILLQVSSKMRADYGVFFGSDLAGGAIYRFSYEILVVSQPQRQYSAVMFVGAIITIITGLIVGVILLRMNIAKDSARESRIRIQNGKDAYHAVIADQRTKFDLAGFNEEKYYEQSIPALTDAVYKLKRFISDEQWKALHALLEEYRSHSAKSTFTNKSIVASVIYADLMPGKKNNVELLKEYLDRFEAAGQ